MNGAATCNQHATAPHHYPVIGGHAAMAERQSISERFWSKVDRRGPNECWLWRGATSRQGRGSFAMGGKTRWASRVAWWLTHGQMPESSVFVCHACDNPSCVNPSHLWLGSNTDNMRDALIKGRHAAHRKSHCRKGHAYTGDNVEWHSKGWRRCKECQRGFNRAFKDKLILRRRGLA